ncbi:MULTISPECIES: hypothetical protein [unclassified Azospirillum]|uniref:hypothetical protein n=1 Tax=unclassified Azospirillum TaxID=2630922 RepID=UPI000B797295|nr:MULTISPECIES: hypothetical protein [unclassified Azospirillum]
MTAEQKRFILASAGCSAGMLSGGLLVWLFWGTGASFAIGLLMGLGIYCLTFGLLPIHLSGELSLIEGIPARLAGLVLTALAGVILYQL